MATCLIDNESKYNQKTRSARRGSSGGQGKKLFKFFYSNTVYRPVCVTYTVP